MRSWSRPQIRLEPAVCILWAFLLLAVPVRWLLALALAAVWHELCHAIAVWLMGGCLHRIHIGLTGARMDTSPLTAGKALFCILAGPIGGALAVLPVRWMPETALCALCLCGFNLLPIYPLDGGRALRCFLAEWIPQRQDAICRFAEGLCLMGLLLMAVWTIRLWGMPAVLVSVILILRLIGVKKPCKLSL